MKKNNMNKNGGEIFVASHKKMTSQQSFSQKWMVSVGTPLSLFFSILKWMDEVKGMYICVHKTK